MHVYTPHSVPFGMIARMVFRLRALSVTLTFSLQIVSGHIRTGAAVNVNTPYHWSVFSSEAAGTGARWKKTSFVFLADGMQCDGCLYCSMKADNLAPNWS